jgi:hypothetical protein
MGNQIERKKDASGQFLPLDLDGWVDLGLVVLVDFITYTATWMLMWAFLQTSEPLRI